MYSIYIYIPIYLYIHTYLISFVSHLSAVEQGLVPLRVFAEEDTRVGEEERRARERERVGARPPEQNKKWILVISVTMLVVAGLG